MNYFLSLMVSMFFIGLIIPLTKTLVRAVYDRELTLVLLFSAVIFAIVIILIYFLGLLLI